MESCLPSASPRGEPAGRLVVKKMRFRKYFLIGLLAITPMGVSLAIAEFLFRKIGNILGQVFERIPYLQELPSYVITLVGFVSFILFITLVGFLTPSFLGRWILGLWEMALVRIPFIKTIYIQARELIQRIFDQRSSFGKPVFIPFPREGIYTLVFVTSDEKWRIIGAPNRVAQTGMPVERKGVSVFLPTNPNPTTGFFTIVPEDLIVDPDLSKEWGIKIAVSGGILVPEERNIPMKENKNSK